MSAMKPSSTIRRVTVYCGAAAESAVMQEAAYGFGERLAREGLGLVFGGGGIGMMRAVADGARAHGGEVIGVIPDLFRPELAHPDITQLIETQGLPARKQRMFELGDAFVALPGGLGTIEELLEVWDWARLGLHTKPIGLLDVDGYYDKLLVFIDEMLQRGFCRETDRGMLLVSSDPAELLASMRGYEATPMERPWARF